MLRKLGKISLFLLLLGLAPSIAKAQTSPVILAINYQSPITTPYIGSQITVYMSAILPTQNYPCTVSSTSGGSLILTGSSLGTLSAGTPLYISDGIRVWLVSFPGSATAFTISNAVALSPALASGAGLPFYVANYNNLANNVFSVYTGTLITGSSGGGPSFSAELGSDFANVILNDSGSQGDNTANDGIWTAVYAVSNLGYDVSNGHFFGNVSDNGAAASNEPYQSTATFNIDGVLPNITTKAFTTSAANYQGMLYLARSSQGLNHVTSFNANNQLGTFNVSSNENDVTVNIQIIGTTAWPLANPVSLPPIFIPTSSVNPIGTAVWDGSDGLGNYVPDGVYQANLYISDLNGLTGVTQTVQIRVVSAEWSIGNITLNPSSLNVNSTLTNGNIITTVSYCASLFTDNMTSLRTSMEVMDWDVTGVQNFNDATRMYSGIWAVNDFNFLSPDGTVGFGVTELDDDPLFDDDENYVVQTACDTVDIPGTVADCYNGYAGPCDTNNYGKLVRVGDGNVDNDWTPNAFKEFSIYSAGSGFGTQTDPSLASVTFSVQVLATGSVPAAGNYRLQCRTTLAALNYYEGLASTAPALADPCTNNAAPVYNDIPLHFYPSQRPDSTGLTGSLNGFGLNDTDSSVVFSVSNAPTNTGDQSPPSVVASSPQNGAAAVIAGTYGPGNPLQAEIQDVGANLNLSSGYTYITLSYANGNGGTVTVGGQVTNNGGGNGLWTLFFTPTTPLTAGGAYTMTVFATDQAGLSVSDQILFTVEDTTAPSVSEVELFSSGSTTPIQLTSFQTVPDGPFSGITEIKAQLSMPSTTQNTIDYKDSTISLYQVSGTVQSPVSLVNNVTLFPPSDGMLDFKLASPITNAGLYRIVIQTFAQNSSNLSFTGPPSTSAFTEPEFTTILNSNALSLYYSGGVLALSGTMPITGLTSGGSSFSASTATVGVSNPNLSSLATNNGEIALTGTATGASSLQIVANGVAQTQPITWTFSSPYAAALQFQTSDLPTGITYNQITLWQYNGSSWSQYSGSGGTASGGVTSSSQTNVTTTFPINFTSGVATDSIFALFYPSTSPAVNALPTTTPLGFKPTRSFNPNNANALYRKAKFYYGFNPVQDVQVRIYDTSGQLVRQMGSNNGVNLNLYDSDPSSGAKGYYFQWDGNNDGGNVVKNGIYLVRYQVTDNSGNVSSQTKLVALIK